MTARMVRNGLHPHSALKLLTGRTDDIRFGGTAVRGAHPGLGAYLARAVWGGEYDAMGFRARRGERVVDIGANVGFFAMLAARRGAMVEAYEPHPETFRYLQANTAGSAVACHRAAVVAAPPPDRKVGLWLHPTHDSRHSLIGVEILTGSALSESMEVPAVSLEEAIGDGCDLLKMDCEGAEFDLLLNTSPEALRRMGRLIVELHQRVGDPEKVRTRLDDLGFRTQIERKEEALALAFAANPRR